MKSRKRLTRQESKEVTRTRLIEAAERVFVRRGFDEASVEEISESAGYSRGAFYSNFESKEQLFLAVIDSLRRRGLDDRLPQLAEPGGRMAVVREWFSNQWRLKDVIALRMEFSRQARFDRSVRRHLGDLLRQELAAYSACLNWTDADAADRAEVVALVLLAVSLGLGSLAADGDHEREHLYTEAARLAFDCMTAPLITTLGQMQ